MNEQQHISMRSGPADRLPNGGPGGGDHRPFLGRFTDATSNIWAENRVLRFFSVLTLIGCLALAFVALSAMKREKTIIVPFGQGVEHLYMVGDTPSESYLVAISRNVIQLVGTYTSSGIEYQLDEVLKLVHPREYGAKREAFRRDVERLQAFREISFATYIRYDEPFDHGPGIIRVPVRRERFVGKSRTSDGGYYELSYFIEEGRFWLTDIQFQRIGEVKNDQLQR